MTREYVSGELEALVRGWRWVDDATTRREVSRRLGVDRLAYAVALGAGCGPPILFHGPPGTIAQVLVNRGGASEARDPVTLVAVMLAAWRCCLLEGRRPPVELDDLVLRALCDGRIHLGAFGVRSAAELYGRHFDPPEAFLAADACRLLRGIADGA